MIRNISIGIDIGTATIKVVVGEFLKENNGQPKIIGMGEAETRGMRHGYVVNSGDVLASLKTALALAEKTSGIKIKRAFVAISSTSLRSDISTGSTVTSKADSEVTALDLSNALLDAESNLNLNNKKVIRSFPVSYRLDGKEVQGRPVGMRGTKLEIKGLFVTYTTSHLEDLIEVIAEAGVETIGVVPSPVAGAVIALSEKQKIVGAALVDIGDQTTSLAVFENGLLTSLFTFPIGSADITNDIALVLKIPLEKAEGLKLGNSSEEYSKKKLDEIIEARLSDIFEYIENHLRKIKRHELLPAGIVFIGGGANTAGLEEFSKSALKLPSRIGSSEMFGSAKTKLRDPAYFTALGLLSSGEDNENYDLGTLPTFWKDMKKSIKSSLKQLMP